MASHQMCHTIAKPNMKVRPPSTTPNALFFGMAISS